MSIRIDSTWLTAAIGIAACGVAVMYPSAGVFLFILAAIVLVMGVRIDGLHVRVSPVWRNRMNSLGPWVLIIGGPVLGFAWFYLGTLNKPVPIVPRVALLHNWPDPVDRANLRAILRNISEILNRDVSPIQLGVHQHTDNIRRNIGTPAANVLIGEMAAFQTRLLDIRTNLYNTYVNGQDYADEAWDVLENTDAIYGDAITLGEYVKVAKAIQAGPADQLTGLLAAPENAVRETNFKLGDWVGASIKRLRRKQEALDN